MNAMGSKSTRGKALGLVVLAAVVTWVTAGCESVHLDEKFRYAIIQKENAAPAQVVAAVREALQALNLHDISQDTTNIDAVFEVRSALGYEYRIIVQGERTNRTHIELLMTSRSSRDQARLILTEIHARVIHAQPRAIQPRQSPPPSQTPPPPRRRYLY